MKAPDPRLAAYLTAVEAAMAGAGAAPAAIASTRASREEHIAAALADRPTDDAVAVGEVLAALDRPEDLATEVHPAPTADPAGGRPSWLPPSPPRLSGWRYRGLAAMAPSSVGSPSPPSIWRWSLAVSPGGAARGHGPGYGSSPSSMRRCLSFPPSSHRNEENLMRIFILSCLAALATAADPVPRGGRVLSIDVNMSQDQAASDNYGAAWALAASCGVTSVGLSLDWNNIEAASAAPGTTTSGAFSDPGGYLAAAEGYYPPRGASLVLTLRPLHNSVKPVPTDLAGTAFTDPQHIMATRFCAMLDWVVARMPNTSFEALVIGSEHDVYLAAHGGWSDYGDFLYRVRNHIRASAYSARIPRIASECTYSTGYVGHPAEVAALNGLCDVAGVSYYAIGADMDALDAVTIRSQLDQLVAPATGPHQAVAGKPVCFFQFGCPAAWKDSGLVLHDRSNRQADFITTAFAFWDAHPTTVRLMDFTWLHDPSPTELATQEMYFGSSDPSFVTFLASLGMRTWQGAGADKGAFPALQHAVRARGWANHVPIANPTHVATAPGVALAVTLTASDADLDALTYTVIVGPAHGGLSGTAPTLTYTPDLGFTGHDTFVFQASDADAWSASATILITVGHSGFGAGLSSGSGSACGAGAIGLILAGLALSLGLGIMQRRN